MGATFGGELRRIRREAGQSIIELAGRMDWAVSYVSDVERGARNPPSLDDIVRMLDHLGQPQALPELIRLASARRPVELKLRAGLDADAAGVVAALVRRLDRGSIDSAEARKIRRYLDGKFWPPPSQAAWDIPLSEDNTFPPISPRNKGCFWRLVEKL